MGRAGRARVQARFDLSKTVRQLLALYGITPARDAYVATPSGNGYGPSSRD